VSSSSPLLSLLSSPSTTASPSHSTSPTAAVAAAPAG
jgi:hypothetical protein